MADIKKKSDIVALNSKIDQLDALLAKSNYSNGTSNKSGSFNNGKQNNKTGWKIDGPKSGEPWTKTVNGQGLPLV